MNEINQINVGKKIQGTKEKRHTQILNKKITNINEKLLMTLENKKDILNYGPLSTH